MGNEKQTFQENGWVHAAVLVYDDGGETARAHVQGAPGWEGRVDDMREFFRREAAEAGATVEIATARELSGITADPQLCPEWGKAREDMFRGDLASKRGRHVAYLDGLGMPAVAVDDVASDLDWEGNEGALAEAVGGAYDERGADMVARAFALMKEAHDGQTQKRDKEPDGLDDVPYSNHPVAVSLSLISKGARAETACAGLLHDVVEDAGVTLGRISEELGGEVASMVGALTKGEGESREAYLARVAAFAGPTMDAKLADRCHNLLRALTSKDAAYVAKYVAESEAAFSPLILGTPWEGEFLARIAHAKAYLSLMGAAAGIRLFEDVAFVPGAQAVFKFGAAGYAKESRGYNLSLLKVLEEKACWGSLRGMGDDVRRALDLDAFVSALKARSSVHYVRRAVEFSSALGMGDVKAAAQGMFQGAEFATEAEKGVISSM